MNVVLWSAQLREDAHVNTGCGSYESLEEALKDHGLEEHLNILHREQMDMESLVSYFFLESQITRMKNTTLQFFIFTLLIPIKLFQMLCSEKDLKDIGIPLGPRKKIMNCVKKWKVIPKILYSPVFIGAQWQNGKVCNVALIVCSFLSTPKNGREDR